METRVRTPQAVAEGWANGWSLWLTAAGGDENPGDLRNEYAGKFGDDAVADDHQDADEAESFLDEAAAPVDVLPEFF